MIGINRSTARCGAAFVMIGLAAAPSNARASQTTEKNQICKFNSTETDNGSNSMEYDPIMAKRADLRVEYNKSPHAVSKCSGTAGINRRRLNDFINRLPKRSDLRMRVLKVGLEQAYAEWSGQA